MQLQTIPYSHYEKKLPQSNNWILGQEIDDAIIVYQAFNPQIANYAVAHQRFGGNAYRFSRMTWIKPNFLWMMYRAGWASKPNQERILAIKISKTGFCNLLEAGIYSSFGSSNYDDHDEWKMALTTSEVRIQWDPDHDPWGEKLARRAVQIGLKGEALQQFNNEYIREITDITDFVHEQKVQMDRGEAFLVMEESIIEIPLKLKEKYRIPNTFVLPK